MPLNPQLFIDGRWLADAEAGHRPLIDPAAESVARGFEIWRRRTVLDRCRVLLHAAAPIRDLAVAHRLNTELDAGMVGINHVGVSQPEMPFGGRGASGDGVEMGTEGLLAYTKLKTVTLGVP